MDRITLTVNIAGQHGHWSAAVNIDTVFRYEFEPKRFTDDKYMADITGDIFYTSQEATTVLRMRKDAAKNIANTLTALILQAMEKDDLMNGFNK